MMLALQNPFYKNPEANAREMLQQRMLHDSEKAFQQSLLELSALKSLLSQGHFCLSFHVSNGCYLCPHPTAPHELRHPCPVPGAHKDNWRTTWDDDNPRELPPVKENGLYLTLRNDRNKTVQPRATDEFKVIGDSVEIVLDLRYVLPAEISVNIGEKSVRVEASRIDKDGIKNCWRQYELPACVQPESGKCILSHDGLLHISVPYYKMEY